MTGSTVRVKLDESIRLPSETVITTLQDPFWSGAGVRVAVRLDPLPPKVIRERGRSAELEELLPRRRDDVGLWRAFFDFRGRYDWHIPIPLR